MSELSQSSGPAVHPAQRRLAEQLAGVAVVCAILYAVLLGASAWKGNWPFDGQGRPVANDFVNIYAAGRLVLQGQAAAAYDWTIHQREEIAAVGYKFDGYYNWPYPPTFLFATPLLALMPLVPAMLAWLAATFALYVAAIRTIVGARIGVVLACGFAGVPWNISAGQNGFLTAALVGGALLWIERRPALAGIALGLLTYKPHFGILFPIVLLVDGRWRVIAAATVTALALAAASWLAFGLDSWRAFAEAVLTTGQLVFTEGRVGIAKQQSLMGLVTWLGGVLPGEILQAIMVVTCASAVVLLWRRPVAYELKAAALGIAVLLSTPYLYIYDCAVLAVPMAFLVRLGLADEFLPRELPALGAASILLFAFPYVVMPTGLVANLIVAALVARRALRRPEAACPIPSHA